MGMRGKIEGNGRRGRGIKGGDGKKGEGMELQGGRGRGKFRDRWEGGGRRAKVKGGEARGKGGRGREGKMEWDFKPSQLYYFEILLSNLMRTVLFANMQKYVNFDVQII